MPVQNGGNPPGIDPALRYRVVEQIPIIVDALEAAVANPSSVNLQRLRDETDKLMRAVGRVLIELRRARNARKGTNP
jgi:hypothetical protein